MTTRLAPWAIALALPLALVILLRSAPKLDVRWEVDPVHFWIVLAAGVVNAGLAIAISEAGRRRRDARLLLIGLAFLVSAGFLGLHALATPNVVVDGGSAGFVLATPIGLVLAGAFAAASAVEYRLDASLRIVHAARWLLGARARADGRVGDRLGRRAAAAARPGHARPGRGPAERARRRSASSLYGYAVVRVLPRLVAAPDRARVRRRVRVRRCSPRR